MISIHVPEKYISLYPNILFIILIILCHVYHIPYMYTVGYIINIIVNYGLKLFFRHTIGSAGNRPIPYRLTNSFDTCFDGFPTYIRQANAYGFPSGHAQTVGYFLAFINQFLPWKKWHPFWVGMLLLFSAWLVYTRVAFQRHTVVQVLFGFMFGVAVFQAFHWAAVNFK